MRWLLGVHEHAGTLWLSREQHARLLWWCALTPLVRLARRPRPSAAALTRLATRLRSDLAMAEQAGWRLEALLTPASKGRARTTRAPRATTTRTPAGAAKPPRAPRAPRKPAR